MGVMLADAAWALPRGKPGIGANRLVSSPVKPQRLAAFGPNARGETQDRVERDPRLPVFAAGFALAGAALAAAGAGADAVTATSSPDWEA